jgi:hypothetical protein
MRPLWVWLSRTTRWEGVRSWLGDLGSLRPSRPRRSCPGLGPSRAADPDPKETLRLGLEDGSVSARFDERVQT